ncbi:MAG TPA: hypothetical protein VGM81_12130 [Burkholderiaceae bacterium]|jgi:protocatechuate 3,4-dioxygenase beta subunit
MIKFDLWARHATRALLGIALTAALAACGGGGGSSGSPVLPGDGSGGSTGSGGTTTTPAYSMGVEVQRSGTATTQVSSTETVQAVATVVDKSGSPVSGVVVTFTEPSVGLLAFQPQAATGLTGSDGKASVDLGAKTNTATGATTVMAAATVGGLSLTANKSIAIAAGTTTTVTPTPATISFVSSSAGDQAIAIKGAGGNGRAEAAILEFKVLDSTGAPINGAAVTFAINTGGAAGSTISPTSAVSDSSGRVTTTVLSGTSAGSIVVVATAGAAPSVKVQSDTLLVSNSVPIASGFETDAANYNLDGNFTGDSTSITARVRDVNGNPVPDGVAVSFQTDYGVVASSTLGGCTTVNGQCSVDFAVQNPRGQGVATVVGSIGVGTASQFQYSIQINMSSGAYTVVPTNSSVPITSITLPIDSCKYTVQARIQDSYGRSVTTGTVVSVPLTSSNIGVTVRSGSPVADALDFTPTTLGFEIDATASALTPPCKVNGSIPSTPQAFMIFGFQTPKGVVKNQQRIDIYYPQ